MNNYFTIFCIIICIHIHLALCFNSCLPRQYGYSSHVCVCNSNYCDEVVPLVPIPKESAVVYTSSLSGLRLERTVHKWRRSSNPKTSVNIILDKKRRFQKIEGFGGAFTDAAGINIAKLPKSAQNNLLSSYFGPQSIQYNIARIPIASCDFSTRNYSYDDVPDDFDLKNFSLAEEDLTKKIPFIKLAMKLSHKPIKFFASPWSAPFWMKTNQMMQGIGTLIGKPGGKYYKSWAKYFIKFLDEYAKHGIRLWAITAQNEPTTGYVDDYKFQVMALTPHLERDFVKMDLGPALKNSAHKHIKIMILDDRRYMLPKWPDVVLSDNETAKHVSYIALHWYADTYTPVQLLDETHENFPNVALFGTEACNGVNDKERKYVRLGDWERGESYAENIIETLNHWYTGWTDWNLALDAGGGPNWVHNYVDSPIIVNSSSGEFYKQPMFYAIGHFSTFLPEGSIRINLETIFDKMQQNKTFLVTSFLRPDGYKVVIILNKNLNEVEVKLNEVNNKSYLFLKVPAKSIQTVIWK